MTPLLSKRSRMSTLGMPLILVLALATTPGAFHGNLDLPPLPSPVDYGDVLIDRTSAEHKVTPVVFSHWAHRASHTCRVCHSDLEFAMRTNDTHILCNAGAMSGKHWGRHCTACHDGKTSFAPAGPEGENCKRCHNADASPNRKKFAELKGKLPAAKYGDEIDWVKALEQGRIKPKNRLAPNVTPLTLDKTVVLEAEMSGIPPAVFSHKTHTEWLDCDNCHPEIFNIKKKTTKHFSMSRILRSEFCGVCHLRIAFPLNECRRCHPSMKK
jgi:c(7)-type cytochrome triheme protein